MVRHDAGQATCREGGGGRYGSTRVAASVMRLAFHIPLGPPITVIGTVHSFLTNDRRVKTGGASRRLRGLPWLRLRKRILLRRGCLLRKLLSSALTTCPGGRHSILLGGWLASRDLALDFSDPLKSVFGRDMTGKQHSDNTHPEIAVSCYSV